MSLQHYITTRFHGEKRGEISAYDRLLIARAVNRPRIREFIGALFDDFLELSGDRLGGDDKAILGGIGFFGSLPVTVIGHHKERDAEENVAANFGMAGPEGYRKALRLMKEAEKFHRPVITLVDTPGAYPGKEAEENGISAAIAENLAQMSHLHTPVVTLITGEGNSGGALGIAVADRVLMLENAVYSILSPEGFSSILWKDGTRVREACEVMGMTAEALLTDGLVDRIIPEPAGGIQNDPDAGFARIREILGEELPRLMALPEEELLERRYEKFRSVGRPGGIGAAAGRNDRIISRREDAPEGWGEKEEKTG